MTVSSPEIQENEIIPGFLSEFPIYSLFPPSNILFVFMNETELGLI